MGLPVEPFWYFSPVFFPLIETLAIRGLSISATHFQALISIYISTFEVSRENIKKVTWTISFLHDIYRKTVLFYVKKIK